MAVLIRAVVVTAARRNPGDSPRAGPQAERRIRRDLGPWARDGPAFDAEVADGDAS